MPNFTPKFMRGAMNETNIEPKREIKGKFKPKRNLRTSQKKTRKKGC